MMRTWRGGSRRDEVGNVGREEGADEIKGKGERSG